MLYSELVEFYLRNHAELFYWAYFLTRNRELSQDLVQDLAITLHENAGSGQEIREPMAYLKQALKYRAYNAIQRRKRELYMAPETMGGFPDQQTQKEITRIDMQMAICSCLEGFPQDRVDAFIQCYVDGYSIDMIAQDLKVSRNTLDQQFYRMRRKIIQVLEKYGVDALDGIPSGYEKDDNVSQIEKVSRDYSEAFTIFLISLLCAVWWR